MNRKPITVTINSAPDYTVTESFLNGEKHMVLPVVMMVEGVHCGSRGAIYHSAEYLSQSPSIWNGYPVTLNHPKNEDGNYISANTDGVEHIGKVLNAGWIDEKLKGEIWLHSEKTKKCSPALIQYLTDGRAVDVSVGVFSDEVEQEGTWNGEVYHKIATTYTPDHLALLPGERGACSWNDGCGIRVNSEIKNKDMEEQIERKKQLHKDFLIQTNEQSLQDLIDKLNNIVNAMDTQFQYNYIVDVFTDTFVYRKKGRDGNSPLNAVLYQQGYAVDSNGIITLSGDAVEVVEKKEYTVISAGIQANENAITPQQRTKIFKSTI